MIPLFQKIRNSFKKSTYTSLITSFFQELKQKKGDPRLRGDDSCRDEDDMGDGKILR